MHAVDVSGSNSGWQPFGSWTVALTSGTPSSVSVSPSSGSGASQTFTLQYSDTAGAANLQTGVGVFQRYVGQSRQQRLHAVLQHCDQPDQLVER